MSRRIPLALLLVLTACRTSIPAATSTAPTAPTASTAPTAAAAASTAAPDARATKAIEDLGKILFLLEEAVPLEQWDGRAGATCGELASIGEALSYRDLWCTECTLQVGDWHAAFRFFPDITAGTCTLQELRADLIAADRSWLEALIVPLSRARGRPRAVPMPDSWESGGAGWESIQRWSLQEDLAYLFWEPRSRIGGSTISYLWRTPPLRWLQVEFADREERWAGNRDHAVLDACREAGLPECEDAMEARSARDNAAVLAVVNAALERRERLPRTSSRASALDYFLATFAADGYVVGAHEPLVREQIAKRGLVYEEGYDSLNLATTLMSELAARDPTSRWGQEAVLDLLAWHDGEDDDDPFRAVIARGEAYLRDHPGSAIERDVILEVASAHETWWSLSKANPQGETPEDLARWKPGAETARKRALALYSLVTPRSDRERCWLEQRRFRLERNIDSGQRAHAPSKC